MAPLSHLRAWSRTQDPRKRDLTLYLLLEIYYHM